MTVQPDPAASTRMDSLAAYHPGPAVWPTVGPGRNPGGLWVVVWLGDGWVEAPVSAGDPVEAIAAAHVDLMARAVRLYDGDTGDLVGTLTVEAP